LSVLLASQFACGAAVQLAAAVIQRTQQWSNSTSTRLKLWTSKSPVPYSFGIVVVYDTSNCTCWRKPED